MDESDLQEMSTAKVQVHRPVRQWLFQSGKEDKQERKRCFLPWVGQREPQMLMTTPRKQGTKGAVEES